MLADTAFLFATSLFSALLAEALSWVLIYRTDSYQKLKSNIENLQKKLDRKKEAPTKQAQKDKKIDRYEETLKTLNREMSVVKMKSTFAVALTMITLFGMLSASFDGIVVAKLPFEPFGIFQGLSHRNLPGNDYTDCSYIFFYVLCSLGIRPNVQKILGTTPPKSASPWAASPYN